MRRSTFACAIAVAIATAVLLAQTADPRLTTADVEKVSGVKGVHLVPAGSQPGAGGSLNFAGPDKQLIAMVNFGTAELYKRAKEQKEIKVGDKSYPMELVHKPLAGVGDEAFDSPPGPMQYVIYARKGANAISVSTYLHGGKPALTIDQLKQLAQIIFSRM